MSPQLKKAANIDRWAESIGGFIINFGLLQDLTFEWIEQLSESGRFKSRIKLPPMKEQIDEIIKLVSDSNIPQPDKDAAIKLWEELLPLVEERNRIAHNSLTFAKVPATGNEVLSLHDTKKLYPEYGCKIKGKNMTVLQISEIRKSAHRVLEIVIVLSLLVPKTQKTCPDAS
jgi:hypothetical protein